ncbi:MAG: rhomboid family intramembrane serine protease [Pseudomonadota bacterium]
MYLVIAIWVVEGVNQLLGHSLNQSFGLVPRSTGGLPGIATMPFLHGGLAHAAANTVPLLILGATALAVAPQRFGLATILIVLTTGMAVWLVARPGTVHVGASGLVFGWFGFVIALGLIERSVRAILGAALVFLLYGGMIWGVLPGADIKISWEAHLFGALAGALIAWVLRERR